MRDGNALVNWVGTPDLGAALASAPVPTLLVDRDGCIEWTNDAAGLLLGVATDGLIGRNLLDHVASTDHAKVRAELRDAKRASQLAVTCPVPVAMSASVDRLSCADLRFGSLNDTTMVVQIVPTCDVSGSGPTLAEQRAFRTALLELSQLAHQDIDDTVFYHRLAERAIEVVPGAQAATVMLPDRDSDRFRIVASAGRYADEVRGQTIRTKDIIRDQKRPEATIHRMEEFDLDRVDRDTLEWMEDGHITELKTIVASPVVSDGKAIAFVSLTNFDDIDAFDTASAETTTVLGRLIADLLQRRSLEAELRRERESYKHLALHDGLTGLANRRRLELAINEALEVVERRGEPMAVLFADLDDFKRVNDELGHDVGDRVLVAAGDALQLATRVEDIVGRWGGDEFVVVAPAIPNPATANRLAERILSMFDAELPLSDGRTVTCHMSIGVAWTDDGTEQAQALVRRADAALYAAKLDGKGRVRLQA